MAEWPAASVARTDVVDPVLWEQAAHDPRIYTYLLRQRGEINPQFEAINIPFFGKVPLSPLAATVLP